MGEEKKNYTVRATLEVRAESPDAAIEQVADALKAGYKSSGMGPVADFKVAEGAPMLDRADRNRNA